MNNAEQWISIKDNQPKYEDFPIWGWWSNGNINRLVNSTDMQRYVTHFDMWTHAERMPAPPPRAKTLAELDAGIGSEGYESLKLGRRFVGSELKKSYFDQACVHLKNAKAQYELFTL